MHQYPHVATVRNALLFLLENRNFLVRHAIEELLLKNLGLGFLETWMLSVMVKHYV